MHTDAPERVVDALAGYGDEPCSNRRQTSSVRYARVVTVACRGFIGYARLR